jgi:hypothetical protein
MLALALLLTPLLSCGGDPADSADTFEPPAAPENGIQLVVPAFELAGGTELERCLQLKAPHTERGLITRIELVARPGLHHASVAQTDRDLADGEVDCEIGIPEELMSDYQSVPEPLFASSTQVDQETVAFPEGVGVPLEAGQQLVLNYHYLNTQADAVQGEVYINLHFADDPEGMEEANLFAFSNVVNISIPAQSTHTLTTTCTFPADARLLTATPHMHQLGTGFTVNHYDGQQAGELLLDSPGWEAPETVWFDPPYEVSAGDGLTFSCAWTNYTDEDVHFGPTGDDEMCTVFGYYYPGDGLLWRADYDTEHCWVESEVSESL